MTATGGPPDPRAAIDHYDRLLAEHYTWMLGGDVATAADAERGLLEALGLRGGAVAVDLGCGPGTQSLALADLGFASVVGVDTSAALLGELSAQAQARGAPIRTCRRDLLGALPEVLGDGTADAVVCMRDTVLHLPSPGAVSRLLGEVERALAPGGRLVLTYRDLTGPHEGLDRFMLVREDEERIMLCVVEDAEPGIATVTDLVLVRSGAGWALRRSSYPKLRLAPAWVADRLAVAGLDVTTHAIGPSGLWTTAARRP